MLQWAARQPRDKVAQAYLQVKSSAQALLRQVRGFDAILTPTTPTPAFGVDTAPPVDQADFTALANLSGLAATAFPLGLAENGLPLSAQVICASDALAIRLAARLARAPPRPDAYL
jgi:aspartyl-tRNA(Asn)/glutamyl-tRNA(Gln) amidotransferase subunit A